MISMDYSRTRCVLVSFFLLRSTFVPPVHASVHTKFVFWGSSVDLCDITNVLIVGFDVLFNYFESQSIDFFGYATILTSVMMLFIQRV